MEVTLPPALEKMINDKVKSVFYEDASEVISDALRKIRAEDKVRELKLSRPEHY